MNLLLILLVLLVCLVLLLGAVLLWQNHRIRQQLFELKRSTTIQRENDALFARIEAYLSLRDRLNLRKGLPYSKDWSASPDFLKLIVEQTLESKPTLILECSSGLSSLMLARCCELNKKGRLIALENGKPYARNSQTEIDRYGLQSCATILHAPLKEYKVNGRTFQWYDLKQLHIEDGSVELLVIDGPPGFLQKESRYPALPLLYDKLADGCIIYLDDAARADEQALVAQWLREFPQLKHDYIKTERGCSLLRIHRA
jgi:predicted O-methyltransferase YrrM